MSHTTKISPKKSPGDITAVILAAGRGNRLRPFTKNLPKCLVKIGEYPILHRQLSALKQNQITDVAIVLGYKKEMIKKFAHSYFPSMSFRFIHNPQFAFSNTLYSLALAAEKLNKSGTIIQLNGDVVFDPRTITLLMDCDRNRSYSALNYSKSCGKEEIKAVLGKDESIALLNKKVAAGKAVGEAIGINKFSPPFWEALTANLILLKNRFACEYFEYAIERTIAGGAKLYPFDLGNLRAVEIDFPTDLEKAKHMFTKTETRL